LTSVLGVYTGHDQSACLLRDGQVAFLIEEERLTRVKHGLPKSVRALWSEFGGHFGYFPWASLAYCLDAAGIGIDDLDALVLPEEANDSAMAALIPIKDRRKVLVSSEPQGAVHHYRHALSAFFASPFERAAVLVIDGDGSVNAQGYEAETGFFFKDRKGKVREVFKNRYPPGGMAPSGLRGGLGWTYDYVSAVLGFVNTKIAYLSEPGKTMGLAPYGKADPDLGERWIRCDGFKLDFAPFHELLVKSGLANLVSFEDRERALVQNENAIGQQAKDLAWKVQDELERAVLHLAERLHAETGAKDLCLAGGVALNSVANGLLLRKGPFERVFIQPAAADNGQAIGLAYEGHLKVAEKQPILPIRHAFGGRPYARDGVLDLIKATGLPFKELPDDEALAKDAASELVQGRFLGWFQGGSEYGPRALGHRSILADPRGSGVKDHLNARVKFREPFRPFAPSVLKERAGEVFDLAGESPYMLLVADVRPEWRAKIPAITHVDGTARIQTVDAEVDPLYHRLISEFAALAGVPLVLNTSFNLRGMPVVETPRDALRCFLYTEMDALYLGRFKVSRPDATRLFFSASPGWKLVIENEVGWGTQAVRARYQSADGKKSVPIRQHPLFATACASLDGKRSFADALALVCQGQRPDATVTAAGLQFVQQLLRAGALRLRVGSVEL
jgi:carbamoyltransferase